QHTVCIGGFRLVLVYIAGQWYGAFERAISPLHYVISAVAHRALEALLAPNVENISVYGNLAVFFLHARRLYPHHDFVVRFFHLAGQQTPVSKRGGRTGCSWFLLLFVLVASKMGERIAAVMNQFEPAF